MKHFDDMHHIALAAQDVMVLRPMDLKKYSFVRTTDPSLAGMRYIIMYPRHAGHYAFSFARIRA